MLVSRRKRQTKLAMPAVLRDTPGISAAPDRTAFSAAKDHVKSAQKLASSSTAKDNDNTTPTAVKRNYNAAQKHAAPSDVSSFENTAPRDFDNSVMIFQDAGHAGQSGVRSIDKTIQHAFGANRRVAGPIDGQRHVKSNQQFRYSHLDKGKNKQMSGSGQHYSNGSLKSNTLPGEQNLNFENSEPILTPAEPIFVFNISKPNVNSLQSQLSNQNTQTKNNPISFTSPQQPQSSSSTISLRPQLPKSKGGNDKHSMGGVSTVQSISKLEDSTERSVHSDRRRCDRIDPK
jgi:hypothetical protein